MNLRTRFALTTALVGLIVALAAALGGQVVVARQLRLEIDQDLSRRGVRVENPGGPTGGAVGRGAPARAVLDRVAAANGPDGSAPDGNARGRRRSAALPAGVNGREAGQAESPALTLNRRCLIGRRGEAVSLAQFITPDGTVEQCLSGQQFPVDSTDRLLAKSALVGSSAGSNARRNVAPRLRTVTVGGERYRMATIAGPVGASQWVRELAGESAVLRRLRWQFVLLGLGATLLAALAGWLLAGRFLRPVQKLRLATDKIAETQNLTELVDASGRDEIASLGRSFNSMIAALATSREQQQRLVLDASHELRTPLTSLRTNIEMANRPRRLSDDDNREVMSAALSEVEELSNVISELVELATDRTADEPLVLLHLADLANDVAERTRRRSDRIIEVIEVVEAGAGRGVPGVLHSSLGAKLETSQVSSSAPILGRPRMLERAIANLVENAVKYSPPGLAISIEVSPTSITVLDQGAGIESKDLPYIFDRFYRSDQARSAQGSGLGLAIVRQIVERHGGEVVARNNSTGGAAVGFLLPRSA